jgi:hypothetical protein
MTLVVTATTGGLMDLGTVSLHIASMWPNPVCVVEADPDGGRLAARHNWEVRPGLVELAARLRSQGGQKNTVSEFVRQHGDGVSVIVAPPGAEPVIAARGVLSARPNLLEESIGTDVIVNVGRVRPDSPARDLIASADVRLLITRTDLEDVVSVVHRTDHLRSLGDWKVLTAGGRYGIHEVDRAVEWPVIADLLPSDRRSSARLRDVVAGLQSTKVGILATSQSAVAS